MRALKNHRTCVASADDRTFQTSARSSCKKCTVCYALENEKLFKWSAVQQFYFTASALPLVSATLGIEGARSLHIKRPATSGTEVKELDDQGNGVRGKASSEVELCLGENSSSIYGGGEKPDPKAK